MTNQQESLKNKNAVIYARYSSENQNRISIEKQIDFCKEYAQKNELNILTTYSDYAITGTDDKRPGFLSMIEDSKQGSFQYVLVYSLDRFSRNMEQQLHYERILKECAIKLISVTEFFTDNSSGFINKNILVLFNEYYSKQLSEKLKGGFKAKLNKIKETHKATFCGGTLAYGYTTIQGENKHDKIIVKNEQQAEVINNIYDWYLAGMGYKAIVSKLNQLHILNRVGKPFSVDNIRSILKYEPYTGVFIRNTNTSDDFYSKSRNIIRQHYLQETRVENSMPVIIDKEKFMAVQKIIQSNIVEGKRHRAKELYLLSGLVHCAKCGKVMIGNNNCCGCSYYICPTRSKTKQCVQSNIKKELLESIVLDYLNQVVNKKTINQLVEFLYKAQKKAFKNTDEKIVKIKRELAGIQNSINACMQALLNASETSETITNSIIEFEKRQKVLKEQLAIIEKEKDMQYEEFSKEQIEQYLSAVSDIKTKSLQSKRNIILLLISKITVDSWKEEAIDPRNKSSKPYFSIKIEGMLGKMCVEKIASWDYQHCRMVNRQVGHSFILPTIMGFDYT